MCGIAGKHYFDPDRVVEPGVIKAMTDIMSYRGPDDAGFYVRGPIALGHRRLSILDLSAAGHQPMCNEDGTVWVIFNGEIYNYRALRSQLEKRGHVFRSNTDTEVIVHAYEEDPLGFVRQFDGMFAFALWDERQQRLVLARDPFGIKPLYYFVDEKVLTFASEIKSILEDHDVPRMVDEQALSNYLSLHYVPAPRTMFKGILKILPGHMLVAQHGACSVRKYWELEKREPLRLPESELADFVYSELKESVRLRLQSDVRVGTLLSGGLDSSATLGLMTELMNEPVPAFSAGYSADGEDGVSEFAYSRLAARHFKADYHEVVVSSEMFLEVLPKAIWHQDEPIGEPAAIPLYYTCKVARECGVTVLLSGEGADELFGGYNRHLGELMSRYYRLLPRVCQRSLETLLTAFPHISRLRKGHYSMARRDWWERYQGWHTVFSPEMKAELLSGCCNNIRESYTEAFDRYGSLLTPLDELNKLMWLDLKVWLPDDLLMKKDKMGMAASVEARVPFLDQRFAEVMFSLPTNMKVRRLTGKYIFKKSMERLLPREIIYRKKAGFPTPIARWMAGGFGKQIGDILLDTGPTDHGYFDRSVVKRLLDEHRSGRMNHAHLLFPLLNFDLWYHAYFSQRQAIRSISAPAVA